MLSGLQFEHVEGHLRHLPAEVRVNPCLQIMQTVRLEQLRQFWTVQETHEYVVVSSNIPVVQVVQFVAEPLQVRQGKVQGEQEFPFEKVPLKQLVQT